MHATGENNERSEPFAMFKKVFNCRHLFIGVLYQSPLGTGQPYRLAQVGTSPITAARNSWVNFVRTNNLKPQGNPEYVQLGNRTIVKVNLKQNNKMVTRLYLSGSGTFRAMSGVFPSWNEVPTETLDAITKKPTNWFHRQLPVYGMQLLEFNPDTFRLLPEEDKTNYLQINQNPDQKRSVAEMLTARLSKLKPTAPPPVSPKKPAAPTIQTGPVKEIAPILAKINANQNRFVQTLAQANEALNRGITPNPAIVEFAQLLAGIQAKQATERANLAKKIEQGRQKHEKQVTQIANSFAASMQNHLDNIITDYLNPNSMTHKMLANSQKAPVLTGSHKGINIPIQLLEGSDRNTIFGKPFLNVPYYLSEKEYTRLLKTLNTDQQLQTTPTVGTPLGEEPPKGTSFIKPKPSETGAGGVDKHGPLTPTKQTTPGAQRPSASAGSNDGITQLENSLEVASAELALLKKKRRAIQAKPPSIDFLAVRRQSLLNAQKKLTQIQTDLQARMGGLLADNAIQNLENQLIVADYQITRSNVQIEDLDADRQVSQNSYTHYAQLVESYEAERLSLQTKLGSSISMGERLTADRRLVVVNGLIAKYTSSRDIHMNELENWTARIATERNFIIQTETYKKEIPAQIERARKGQSIAVANEGFLQSVRQHLADIDALLDNQLANYEVRQNELLKLDAEIKPKQREVTDLSRRLQQLQGPQ
jgi:hypothetical protein